PQTTQVRSGEAALTRITGAQAPTGIPVTITNAERPRRGTSTARGGARPGRGRRSPVSSKAAPAGPPHRPTRDGAV
ncbi:ATP-dependent helicase, partial [Streptomyces sp. NPDC006923]